MTVWICTPPLNVRRSELRSDQTILNATFALAGTMTTYLGTMLPTLVTRWSLTDAQSGELFTAQFAGAMAGSLSQGWIGSRWGAPRSVAIGYLLMAFGIAAVVWGGPPTVLAAMFCSGVGIGWAVPASNWLAARYSRGDDQVRAINVLNTAWCAGAVAGPALIARGLTWFGFEPTLLVLTAVLLCASATACLLTSVDAGTARPATTPTSRRRVRSLAFVAAGMLFLYVGFENGISGWTPTLAARELMLSNTDASLALSAFWGSVLVARALASFTKLSRWIGLPSLMAGLSSTALGIVLMTATHNRIALGVGVVLAGLGCSTIFPTIVSLFQIRGGAGSESWLGFIIASGSLGATIIPWWIGASSSRLGGLRWSMLAILVASVVAVAALVPSMREERPA